ncbi:phosphotransferase enzyme family protein [Priestia abyssalis]|uniref:phosphotransferase enzyme family protein n=1 Tax=Priestia abyssalis TaxID=1221450 RepID=UPI00147323FE|nr:phosphotransferase [Priestia abyssalis]
MEQAVGKLFSTEILNEAASQFGAEKDTLKMLGDFENYVYEVTRGENSYVLRLTHSSHRSREQVEAELDWILFLKRKGVEVAAPVLSARGQLLERLTVPEGEFIVSLFEKAPGCLIRVDDDLQFHESLFSQWGEMIGKMHNATRAYTPRAGVNKRMDWQEEELGTAWRIAEKEPFLADKIEKLLKQIQILPVNENVYGLIHTDVHSGNFFFDGETMTIFDFDDCCYHWFINDLAIPLFYSSFYRHPKDEQERQKFARRFFRSFLVGYFRHFELDEWWLEKLPLFLMFRDITFYAALRLKLSDKDLTPRVKEMIAEVKGRIEAERPVVDIDYRQICQDLSLHK